MDFIQVSLILQQILMLLHSLHVHEYLGDDKYEPVTGIEKDPYGVVYVHKIQPKATFKYLGFSTIGLQLYPRSSAS